MGKYIVKRLLMMIPVILAVAILIFTIMTFVPGNPASLILGADATEEQILIKEHELGLDQPYVIRLGNFLKQTFVDFDFGRSYWTNTSVTEELMARFPRTLAIAGFAMLFTVIIGIPLGIFTAIHEGTFADRIGVLLCVIGVSMPTFWLAMLFVLLFALKLKLLPAQGMDGAKYFVLPVVAQSLGGISGMVRTARAAMLEVVRADYVTTARSKGLTNVVIVLKHAFRNALIPIVTTISLSIPFLIGGAVVTEQIFAWPGIGSLMITAITSRDYPVIMGVAVLICGVVLVANLILDLIYAALDPRIKFK